MIKLDISKTLIAPEDVTAYEGAVASAQQALENATCEGNGFLGWLHLPSQITPEFLEQLQSCANTLREHCDTVVVAGIGGSYLGARAVIEALGNSFQWLVNKGENPNILFAGNNIGEDYLYELTEYLKDRKFGVINISKSGTTTETALAFRLLKKQCEAQMGKDVAREVIVAVTDAKRGAARTCADKEGYKSFIIPDNVGGRFSVLTPVGLLPIAVAGISIRDLVAGAVSMEKATSAEVPFEQNLSAIYAATRNALYQNGKSIEILANFHPKLHFIAEWWKQLYGESEGKDGKGLFPTATDFTTDLHSLGQFIQQGSQNHFETVINVVNPTCEIVMEEEDSDLDGLNYLAGKTVDFANKSAMNGTILAHVDGGIPIIQINIDKIDEFTLGELFYTFEFACGVSGYTLGVNPFNQPGVESYKKNMFALLGKPGNEELGKELLARLNK